MACFRMGIAGIVLTRACALAAASVPADEPTNNLTVIYTGRMLGYARECKEEILRPSAEGPRAYRFGGGKRKGSALPVKLYQRECARWEGSNNYPAQLRQLLDRIRRPARESSASALTLGTGDNFALDYRARTVLVDEGPGKPMLTVGVDELHYLRSERGWVRLTDFQAGEDFRAVLEDSANGDSEIDGDSVAGFLAQAGYNALVPGKHDFYFGPERLRQIGRLLARNQIEMLGANLVIRGEALDPPPMREDRYRKRNYTRRHSAIRIDVPKAVLPWWRRVKVSIADGASFSRLELCKSAALDQACSYKPATVIPFVETEKGIYEIAGKVTTPLEPGETYHLCAYGLLPRQAEKDSDGLEPPEPYCEIVRVERPFFQYLPGSSAAAPGGFPAPYFVSTAKNVVVFGVVALGLEKQVGRLNTIWRQAIEADEQEHELRVETVDPMVATSQLLDYCVAKGDCPEGRTRILLAHMPNEAADGLRRRVTAAGREAFDLVITEANSSQFTPFPKVEYPADYPALVVSPRMPYDAAAPGAIGVHAQAVEIKRNATRRGPVTTSGMQLAEPSKLSFEDSPVLNDAITRTMEGLTPRMYPSAKPEDSFRELTLEIMRRRTGSSVALLQKRDLFETAMRLAKTPDKARPAEDQIRAALEGILWKGDFLMTRLVKGSALKQIMARSKEYDRTDADIYHNQHAAQLGLLALGLWEDPDSGKWVIDGAVVDDEKPYKVALPDYLAFGDTGYPELGQALVGALPRAAELERSFRISEYMYDELTRAYSRQSGEPQAAKVNFSTYFDYLKWKPSLVPPPSTQTALLRDYFRGAKTRTPALPGVSGHDSIENSETLAQVRSRWRLVNEKNEFSILRSRNNQPDQKVLLSRFQGVQESRVTAAESSLWGAAWAVELRREKRRSTDFLRTESRFQLQEIQNSEGLVARTYPQNEFSLEAGWRGSFTPVIHQRRWRGVLLSGIWNTQLENPRIGAQYTFPADSSNSCPAGSLPIAGATRCNVNFDAKLGRTSRYLAKAGLRRETRDSWAEAGLFGGMLRRTVSYEFLGGKPKLCDLGASLLTDCLTGLEAAVFVAPKSLQRAMMGQSRETGAFLNFNWRIPLRADNSVQLVLENRGRYYFDSQFDNQRNFALDTRLNNLFSAGLAVPIAGKLALKPTWTLFHFRSKGDPGKNRQANGLTGNSIEVKLEYRFDWLEGQPWKKVLRYGGGMR